jgi:hypothetical protein
MKCVQMLHEVYFPSECGTEQDRTFSVERVYMEFILAFNVGNSPGFSFLDDWEVGGDLEIN